MGVRWSFPGALEGVAVEDSELMALLREGSELITVRPGPGGGVEPLALQLRGVVRTPDLHRAIVTIDYPPLWTQVENLRIGPSSMVRSGRVPPVSP